MEVPFPNFFFPAFWSGRFPRMAVPFPGELYSATVLYVTHLPVLLPTPLLRSLSTLLPIQKLAPGYPISLPSFRNFRVSVVRRFLLPLFGFSRFAVPPPPSFRPGVARGTFPSGGVCADGLYHALPTLLAPWGARLWLWFFFILLFSACFFFSGSGFLMPMDYICCRLLRHGVCVTPCQ